VRTRTRTNIAGHFAARKYILLDLKPRTRFASVHRNVTILLSDERDL